MPKKIVTAEHNLISNSDSLPAWKYFTQGWKEKKGTVSGNTSVSLKIFGMIFGENESIATSGAAKPGLSCGCSRLSRLCRLIFSCALKEFNRWYWNLNLKAKCGTEISQWKQIICLIPGGAHWNRGGSGCKGSLWMGGCQVLLSMLSAQIWVDNSKYVISTDSVTSKYVWTLQSKRPTYSLGAQFGHRCFLPPGDHHS